jgi:hypothetical protein
MMHIGVDYDLNIYTAYLAGGYHQKYALKMAKEAFLQKSLDDAYRALRPASFATDQKALIDCIVDNVARRIMEILDTRA